ncbi:MAG TPA: cation transporter [Chthoniobacterales bacterium]
MKSERSALMLSTVVALFIGAIAIAIGIATGSGAILLDGAFNLCFFATALVTLRVARMLERPDDDRYPFGYLQFEPLINMVRITGVVYFNYTFIFCSVMSTSRP